MSEFLIKTVLECYLDQGHVREQSEINCLQLPLCIANLIAEYAKYRILDYENIYTDINSSVYADIGLTNPKYFVHVNLDISDIAKNLVKFSRSYVSKYSSKCFYLQNIDMLFHRFCEIIRDRDIDNIVELLMPDDIDGVENAKLDIDDIRNGIRSAVRGICLQLM